MGSGRIFRSVENNSRPHFPTPTEKGYDPFFAPVCTFHTLLPVAQRFNSVLRAS